MTDAVRERFTRCPTNPVLSARNWPYPANAVFNPGATTIDGLALRLCGVEDRRGISHLKCRRGNSTQNPTWQLPVRDDHTRVPVGLKDRPQAQSGPVVR